jgi:hypothetical protein
MARAPDVTIRGGGGEKRIAAHLGGGVGVSASADRLEGPLDITAGADFWAALAPEVFQPPERAAHGVSSMLVSSRRGGGYVGVMLLVDPLPKAQASGLLSGKGSQDVWLVRLSDGCVLPGGTCIKEWPEWPGRVIPPTTTFELTFDSCSRDLNVVVSGVRSYRVAKRIGHVGQLNFCVQVMSNCDIQILRIACCEAAVAAAAARRAEEQAAAAAAAAAAAEEQAAALRTEGDASVAREKNDALAAAARRAGDEAGSSSAAAAVRDAAPAAATTTTQSRVANDRAIDGASGERGRGAAARA